MVDVVEISMVIVMRMKIDMSMIMKIEILVAIYNQSNNIHHILFNFRFNDLTIIGFIDHSFLC